MREPSSAAAAERGDVPRADAVVLGAGISGLVAASVLRRQGIARVVVVEEYAHVGGNHLDVAIGDYTFDVGSFIFQDDSPLLGHFPELLSRYVPIDPTWGKLNPQGRITGYPFSIQDDFLAAGPVECTRILGSTVRARLRRRRMRSARDFAEHWIGPRLMRRSGLENYMERFCGLPADRIDLRFAESRMMWIAEQASARALVRRATTSVRRRRPPPPPANRQMVRPREGFAYLYASAVQRLEEDGVSIRLGAELTCLRAEDSGFHLQLGDRDLFTDRVVSTIPIDRSLRLCGLPIEKPLPSVTLLSLFFSFSGRRGFDDPILYNFSHEGTWKRLTMYSDFYGPSDGREFFAVEVIADPESTTVESAEADVRRHAAANGLFDGDLRLEGSHLLREAYPIYTEGAGERAERAIAALRNFGVESLGRQGGFQYQPTARVSTVVAEAALGHGPQAAQS